MTIKFFGQYLLERGAISVDLLLKAVDLQESVNLRFGESALALKLITESDLKRILKAQRVEDLMFGEMALQLGILKKEQIEQILMEQQRGRLRIGEALVRVGALRAGELHRLLEEFSMDQGLDSISRTVIPSGVRHPEIWEFCADLSAKMFLRMVGAQCRVGACVLVDRLPKSDFVAGITLTGMVSASYHLTVSDPLRNRIAGAVLMDEDVTGEPEELLEDAVLEFANIVCGNVAAKASQYGKNVEILPPFLLRPGSEGIPVPAKSYGLFFPLHLPDGERAEVTLFVKR